VEAPVKFSNQQKKAGLELGFVLCMILIGTILALILYNNDPDKYRPTIFGLEAIGAVGLGLLFYIYLTNSRRHVLKSYLLASAGAVFILLVSAFK
jgi:hypothetical protein